MFPELTLDKVRKSIEGRDEFIEADRGDCVIFNYNVNFPDTFPPITDELSAVRRECRGLTFYKDGRIAARKFHKFFNIGERDETQVHVIDFTRPHVVFEKLDGSMISPFLTLDNLVQFHTKMGYTDVAVPVQQFAERGIRRVDGRKVQAWYKDFAFDCMKSGLTPLFEWCSRQQRIVIDHPEDDLILTAVRRNDTGQYLTLDQMRALAEPYKIPVVRVFSTAIGNIHEFLEEARQAQNIEGYVIRFDNQMYKVKGEWYCEIHGAVSQLVQEKNIWRMALENNLDDVKPFLEEDQRHRLEQFETVLATHLHGFARGLQYMVDDARGELMQEDYSLFNDDQVQREMKKRFATEHVPKMPAEFKQFAFSIWDGKNPEEVVRDHVLKNTGSATQIEKMRDLLGNEVRFNPVQMDED